MGTRWQLLKCLPGVMAGTIVEEIKPGIVRTADGSTWHAATFPQWFRRMPDETKYDERCGVYISVLGVLSWARDDGRKGELASAVSCVDFAGFEYRKDGVTAIFGAPLAWWGCDARSFGLTAFRGWLPCSPCFVLFGGPRA